MALILEMHDVDAFYGERQVLFGVNLGINKGTTAALLGANGSGKTSTLRAICGMLATRGTIKIDGTLATGKPTNKIARLGVGHVPDGRGTFASLTVRENLQIGSLQRGDEDAKRFDLDRVLNYFPRLRERYKQQAGTLSGGEQQMLAISRALLSKPKLLLLDEPSFGLAPIVIQEIFANLMQIRDDEHLTILLVEQNARIALDFAERAFLIETGRMVFRGSSKELGERDDIRRAYLGA